MALTEFHATAQVVNEQWTPEITWLMFRERLHDLKRRTVALEEERPQTSSQRHDVSDVALFKLMKIDPRSRA